VRRIWSWYRERRWWTRTIIAVPVVLVSLIALYLFVRFFSYQAVSRATAGEFTPEGAQVVLRCSDGADAWARFQKSDAGRVILTKALRDIAIREPINEFLKANDLPTLTDLDDRRFHDRTHGLYREAMILRAAGRDVMASVRLGDRADQVRFCVATKIGYWDYCLTPFAGLAPGLFGGQTVDVAGTRCIKVQGVFVAFAGAIVILSDDTVLMAAALKRKGVKEPPPKAVRVVVAFEKSRLLDEWKKAATGFPFGIASVVANPETMRRLTLDFDVQGGELVVEAAADGLIPGSTALAATEPARWAPSGGAGAIAINVNAEPFWRWLETTTNAPLTGNPSQMQKYGTQLMKDAMRELVSFKFPSEVLPKINGSLTVLAGAVTGAESRQFAVAALVFKSDDPGGAMEALSRICLQAIGDSNGQVQWLRTTESGFASGHVRFQSDPMGMTDYKCPCVAIVNDTIVFANNFEFLKLVLATASGDAPGFTGEELFRSAQKRLASLGLKKVFAEGMVATGLLNGPTLRDGLEGYFPIWARTEMDTSENMRRVRGEILQENQKAGRAATEDEVTASVIDRMNARVEEAGKAMRDASKPLDYLRYGAFEVERTGEAGVVVRVVFSIKGK
jgi:hypothetical protein